MTLGSAVAAEWWKLRSAHWMWYLVAGLVAAVLVPAALARDAVNVWDHARPAIRAHIQITPLWVLASLIVDLVTAAMGVLTVTREYASGMMRVSLAAVPQRGRLMLAKSLTVAGVALGAGAAGIFSAYAVTAAIVNGRPIPYLTVPLAHEIPVLLSLTVAALVFGILGLGLGFLWRSAEGAFLTLLGFLYVFPMVALHLPGPWNERLAAVMIPALAGELSGAPGLAAVGHAILSPGWALAALIGYVVGSLAAVHFVFRRRDV